MCEAERTGPLTYAELVLELEAAHHALRELGDQAHDRAGRVGRAIRLARLHPGYPQARPAPPRGRRWPW